MNDIGKSRSFLTEFIIVILFFSIASVVVLNTYSKANDKSRESQFLAGASLEAENIEANLCNLEYDYDNPLMADNNSVNVKLNEYGFGDNKTIYYDEKFNKTEKDNAKYIGKIVVMLDESREYSKVISYELTFTAENDEKLVYSISFNKIIFKGGSEDEQ